MFPLRTGASFPPLWLAVVRPTVLEELRPVFSPSFSLAYHISIVQNPLLPSAESRRTNRICFLCATNLSLSCSAFYSSRVSVVIRRDRAMVSRSRSLFLFSASGDQARDFTFFRSNGRFPRFAHFLMSEVPLPYSFFYSPLPLPRVERRHQPPLSRPLDLHESSPVS